MKDQEPDKGAPDEAELLEVSQVRPRSKVTAEALPRPSPPRLGRIVGRVLPARARLGLAAAILTATPAAAPTMSTAEVVTTNRVVQPPVGYTIALAGRSKLNKP